MSRNPDRTTCRCGKGKVSAWDGKCGHCRSPKEQRAYVAKHVHGEFRAQIPNEKAPAQE